MAYKFQIGEAKLSGSITQTDGAFTGASTIDASGDLTVDSITMAEFTVAANGNTDIDGTLNVEGVPTFQAGAVFSSGITTAGAIAGATTISGSGNITSGGSFLGAGIGLSDASGIVQENGGLAQSDGEMHLDSNVAGAGLALSSGVLSVDIDELDELAEAPHATQDEFMVSDNGTEKRVSMTNVANGAFALVSGDATIASGGALTIANGAVENDMLAGSIANAKLANSSITLTQGAGMAALGAVSLGGSITVAVDGVLEDLDSLGAASSDGEFIVATGAGAFAYESGNTARTSLGLGTGNSPQFTNLTLSGDLTVNGTQTIINSTAVEIADKNILLASGSANGAAAAGAGLTIEGPEVQWKYEQNGESNAAADASSSGDIWIASGSAGLVDIQAANFYGTFVGDGAELTGVVASSMIETLSTKTANYTLDPTAETIVLANAASSNVALTLPAASGLSGVVIKVKRIDNTLANAVSIAPDSGESLEFVTDNVVSLDTQGAALSLVCNGTAWFIM